VAAPAAVEQGECAPLHRIVRVEAGVLQEQPGAPPSGTRVQVTTVSSRPPRQAQRSRRGSSNSSTSQSTTPSKPWLGRGVVRKVNWCPGVGRKSFGINQRASRSESVNARQTFAGG
jgi:hypothetical protein